MFGMLMNQMQYIFIQLKMGKLKLREFPEVLIRKN